MRCFVEIRLHVNCFLLNRVEAKWRGDHNFNIHWLVPALTLHSHAPRNDHTGSYAFAASAITDALFCSALPLRVLPARTHSMSEEGGGAMKLTLATPQYRCQWRGGAMLPFSPTPAVEACCHAPLVQLKVSLPSLGKLVATESYAQPGKLSFSEIRFNIIWEYIPQCVQIGLRSSCAGDSSAVPCFVVLTQANVEIEFKKRPRPLPCRSTQSFDATDGLHSWSAVV